MNDVAAQAKLFSEAMRLLVVGPGTVDMKKWLLVGIAVVAGLAAVFVLVVGRNLESYLNDNKDLFLEQIEAALGRDVETGRIGLSFDNGLGVRVEDLQIAEDPNISNESFLRAESLEVRIKILPALTGRYEVARIELIDPEITLIETADGMNVSSLGASDADTRAASDAAGSETSRGAIEATALAIALFDVSNGRLRYVDATASPATETVIEQLDFRASDISTTSPLVFELSAALGAGSEPNLFASGSVGPIRTDTPSETPIGLTISADGVTGEQAASLSTLAEALPENVTVTGPLELEATLSGTLASMKVTTAGRANQADIRIGDALHKPVGRDFRFSLSATRSLDTISIDDAEAVIGPIRTSIAGVVKTGEQLTYDLQAVAAPFDVAGLAQVVPALADATATGKMRFDLQIRNGPDGAVMVLGTVGLDKAGLRQVDMPTVSDVSASIKLRHDSLELPTTTFLIGGKQALVSASVTHFEAPTGALAISAPQLTPASLGLAAIGRSGDTLETVDLQVRLITEAGQSKMRGTLRSNAGRINGIDYTSLIAKFAHADGRVTLEPATLSAFGGSLETRGSLAIGSSPSSDFDLHVRTRGVDVTRLSAWVAPSAGALLSGTVDAAVALRGATGTWERIRSTLSGDGKVTVRDGRIKDVNIAESVLHAVTGIPGLSTLLSADLRKNYPGLFSTGSTEFDQLVTSLDMVNGRISTRDLVLSASDYAISADGTLGLDRTVDLKAQLVASRKLTHDLVDSVGAINFLTGNSGRVEIPFTLNGDITSAKPRPDGNLIAQALQRALIGGIADQLFGR